MKSKPRSSRVTLANVAARAGVSTTTVSLILSGREEYIRQFHPDTVDKVRRSADRLGYRTNLFASGLPTKASSFFAIILQEVGNREVSTWHHWGFEGDLLAGVIQEASENGVYPIVATAHPQADEAALRPMETIIAGGVFGSIVRTPNPHLERYLRLRMKQGQPMVVVFPAKLAAWPTNAIDVDNVALGETAGRLLAAQGRRAWALVHFRRRGFEPLTRRTDGFRQAALDHGATIKDFVLPLGLDELRTRDLLAPRLRRAGVDGVFAVDSVASVGALLACVKAGLVPGDDFHLVGCDCAFWQSSPLPNITSVDISWRDVGMAAIRKLCELSRAGESQFSTLLIRPRIVEGGTCPASPRVVGGTAIESPPVPSQMAAIEKC